MPSPKISTPRAMPPHRISIVTPSIPTRATELVRALRSAAFQSFPPAAISVAVDLDREGAAVTRTRACQAVETEWIAFLDDDDELWPDHLLTLATAQAETGADVVYPWCEVVGGSDPFPQFEGQPWDPAAPHLFPITTLVRTEVVEAAGYFLGPRLDPTEFDPPDMTEGGEDWPFWLRVNEIATIHHHPERTWTWHHHGGNTSGRPDRW